MTLDRQYYQMVAIDGVDDAIDVTADGSILYDTSGDLHERTKDGKDRLIRSCSKTIPGGTEMMACYSNTVNWVPADDTVLLSFPYIDTVAQVDRKTGTLVGQYGNASPQARWRRASLLRGLRLDASAGVLQSAGSHRHGWGLWPKRSRPRRGRDREDRGLTGRHRLRPAPWRRPW
jgi:hypothetical protein